MLEMDDGVALSDPMRGVLLLEGAGLAKTQQLMIKTAAGHHQSFDTYAKFLLEFHGQVHLKSWSAFGSLNTNRSKGKGKVNWQILLPWRKGTQLADDRIHG